SKSVMGSRDIKNELPDIIKEVGFDFDWDSKKVWKLNLPIIEMKIEELLWHFEIPFWEKEDTNDYNLTPNEVIKRAPGTKTHRQKVDAADLQYPIDIMENKGRWLILDGLHRLVKAFEAGQKTVKVRKVPREKIPEILRTQK
ncbi:MAG: ParB N-terminal domain-containing protein, partial [Candidatus Liptonbacteria bacterium]|nr:ParB N-terminal domain-containing protein [Candidatus Liptonbacteria bacterium]